MSLFERQIETPTVSLAELLTGNRARIEGHTMVSLTDYAEQIVSSGFPGLRHLSGRALRAQLDGYLHRIVDHEIPDAGLRLRRPATLRRWLISYATATASTASYERIRDSATGGEADKPARSTTRPYRDILERIWIVDPVPPWLPSRNLVTRIGRAPKHHLCDPALAARLLGVDVGALLDPRPHAHPRVRNGPLLGVLFESLVTLGVRTCAQAAEATVHHFRSNAGEREIDLIVARGDGRVVAIEVKLTATARDHDLRHLRWLAGRLGEDLLDAVIVTTGTEAYRRPDGVAVVPAALLGP